MRWGTSSSLIRRIAFTARRVVSRCLLRSVVSLLVVVPTLTIVQDIEWTVPEGSGGPKCSFSLSLVAALC